MAGGVHRGGGGLVQEDAIGRQHLGQFRHLEDELPAVGLQPIQGGRQGEGSVLNLPGVVVPRLLVVVVDHICPAPPGGEEEEAGRPSPWPLWAVKETLYKKS